MSDKEMGYAEKIIARRSRAIAPEEEAEGEALKSPLSNVSVIGSALPVLGEAHDTEGEAAAKVVRRREAVRLNIKFKGGRETSLPYIHLVAIEWNGEDEIILDYPWYNFRISGRNMKKLKRRLDLHIQASIQEVDRLVDKAKNDVNGYAVYDIKKEEKPREE